MGHFDPEITMKRLSWTALALIVIAGTLAAQTPSASDLLKRMSLEDKIGQMTQPARDYIRSGDIATYRFGSVLSGGGSVPANNSVAGWRKMIEGYQAEALSTPLKIPLIYGVDAVHGHNNLRDATIFPHNIGLGAAGDADLVFRVARATTEELKATGITWTFAPCVAVVQDLRWGRTYEGYSKDPVLSSKLAAAAVRGFQGETLGETGVAASVKHFVADGGTSGGIDQGDAKITREQLEAIFLPPYEATLPFQPATVMASFSSINGVKMHANRDLLTGWLKEQKSFGGFLVSDWGAVKQLAGSPAEQIATAINAGIDMVMVPDNFRDFIRDLKAEVEAGRVPMSRIDDAVTRILTVKIKIGLFENPVPQGPMNLPAHAEVAKEAVQRSFTLLKNADAVLPLKKGAKVLVVGAKADDEGALCGGWTLTWQGSLGKITAGETVLEGLVRVLGKENVRFSPDAEAVRAFKPSVVIFVAGESPYAEMKGDSTKLELNVIDRMVFERLTKDKKLSNLPLVTLVVSGRPLIMNDVLEKSAAVAALWLPGSEAGSVAEVLSGQVKPSGRLPQPWPKTADQSESVWTLGHGLSY
jgi:beta-glucosidase